MLLHVGLHASLLFLSACLSSAAAIPHVVTSVLRLARLANFELSLLDLVHQSSAPAELRNFADVVQAEHEGPREVGMRYVDLPINQYRLIRRFTVDWPAWRADMRREKRFSELYQALSEKHDKIDQFSSNDLPVAAHALTAIEAFYGERAKLLPGDQSTEHPTLTALEVLELAATTFVNNVVKDEYSASVLAQYWLKLFNDRFGSALPEASLASRVASVLHKNRDKRGLWILAQQEGQTALKKLANWQQTDPIDELQFRAELTKTDEARVCRYTEDRATGLHYCLQFRSPMAPFAPFKLEILSVEPYVAVVHNFLPRQMARRIIESRIQVDHYVSGLLAENGTTEEDFSIRLSEASALAMEAPVSRWLDRRVEVATRLLPNSQEGGDPDGEGAQIVNYGVGGFYKGHYDFLYTRPGPLTGISEMGDRLATVLVYLSDVHSGGHTAFPKLGVSVVPRAGRALVWFNLDPRDGESFGESLHCACPVNVGEKWVMNKWIRSHKKTGHARPIL